MNERILLSKQEKKILVSLSSGSLYKEIAADHRISINTVKKHLKNVYRKLGVNKRTLAIEKFVKNPGMFEIVTAENENHDIAKTA